MQIDAIEEAFIRGEWEDALERSKEILLQPSTQRDDGKGDSRAEEALLAMYLQSVYELGLVDEVAAATVIVRSQHPLAFSTSMQWIQFLIVMDHRQEALDALNELLLERTADLQTNPADGEKRAEYASATEILVMHILLPHERPSKAIKYLSNDTTLDKPTRERLLEIAREKGMETANPLSSQTTTATQPVSSGAFTRSDQRPSSRAVTDAPTPSIEDQASDLFTIGGTALAAAAVALGVYSYRDRLREGLAQVGPAISQGLADAKYALFES